MGVSGLWSVLERCRSAHVAWEARVEDDRDLIVVDSSSLDFLVVQRGMPDALLALHTVGRYEQHANCLRAWLCAWLERGFSILLVLDGSLRVSHAHTSVARKRRALAKNGPLSSEALSELRVVLAHAREEEYEPYSSAAGDDDGVRKPPLYDAVAAAVLTELRAKWGSERVRALTAEKDADVLLAAVFRRERARIAAVLTPDSDFFMWKVERIVNIRQTTALLDGSPAGPLVFKMYGQPGSVGAAVLEFAREQAERNRPDTGFQSVGLKGSSALIDVVPDGMLCDIAACLGNDSSMAVRKAAEKMHSGPWRVIRRLLSKVAFSRGWRDKSGRACQKLFKEAGLESVAKHHWKGYCAARDEYGQVPPLEELLLRPEPFALRLTSLRGYDDSRAEGGPEGVQLGKRSSEGEGGREGADASAAFLRALCDEHPFGDELWVPRVVRDWLGCGLGTMAMHGCQPPVYTALLPLRAFVARTVCERLAPPVAGWAVHELTADVSGCVPLHVHAPLRSSTSSARRQGAPLPEGCFAPAEQNLPVVVMGLQAQPLSVAAAAVRATALESGGGGAAEEEDEDDWEALADGGRLSAVVSSLPAEDVAQAAAREQWPELHHLLLSLGLIAPGSADELAPAVSAAEHGAHRGSALEGQLAARRIVTLSCAVLEHVRSQQQAGAHEPLRPSNLFCIGEHVLLLALASSERFPARVLLDVVRALLAAVAARA